MSFDQCEQGVGRIPIREFDEECGAVGVGRGCRIRRGFRRSEIEDSCVDVRAATAREHGGTDHRSIREVRGVEDRPEIPAVFDARDQIDDRGVRGAEPKIAVEASARGEIGRWFEEKPGEGPPEFIAADEFRRNRLHRLESSWFEHAASKAFGFEPGVEVGGDGFP